MRTHANGPGGAGAPEDTVVAQVGFRQLELLLQPLEEANDVGEHVARRVARHWPAPAIGEHEDAALPAREQGGRVAPAEKGVWLQLCQVLPAENALWARVQEVVRGEDGDVAAANRRGAGRVELLEADAEVRRRGLSRLWRDPGHGNRQSTAAAIGLSFRAPVTILVPYDRQGKAKALPCHTIGVTDRRYARLSPGPVLL